MKSSVDAIRRAAILTEGGHFSEAEFILERILAKNPGDGVALHMIGTIYAMARRNGIAMPLLSMAAALSRKGNPEVHVANLVNLGPMLRIEGHAEESERVSREAIALDPNCSEAWNNLASCGVNDGRPEEGEKFAREALRINPAMPEAHQNLGQCLLEQGKWETAWDEYEWRFKTQDYIGRERTYPGALWDGKPTGTLVVHGEQGLGDEVMFLSLIAQVKPLCRRLIVEANHKLKTLLRRSLGCEVVSTQEEAIVLAEGKIDAFISMGSLARLFRGSAASFKDQSPYLAPDHARAEYWRKRIETEGRHAPGSGPYVALAWSGGTQKTHAEIRNPPVELFADLVHEVPANFVSIQYTRDAGLQARMWGIPHWQEAINDLDEQAALISACDMTISVAQTALHISGALGKPTIGVIGSKPAWRYGLKGQEMVWYPSAQLFRQEGEDWAGVMRKVIDQLGGKSELKAA